VLKAHATKFVTFIVREGRVPTSVLFNVTKTLDFAAVQGKMCLSCEVKKFLRVFGRDEEVLELIGEGFPDAEIILNPGVSASSTSSTEQAEGRQDKVTNLGVIDLT
jgi:hypothetical protein